MHGAKIKISFIILKTFTLDGAVGQFQPPATLTLEEALLVSH
jgi:hypothetical protein